MDLTQFVDGLDLNGYEKEIVLFLSSIDNANANIIYKNTKVPKGRIYSVLNSLFEKGFVKIIPTNPKKYKIDSIQDSLRNYLENEKSLLTKKLEEVAHLHLRPKIFPVEKNAPSVYTFT